ncbi:3-isopropylmalate dehydratase, small subunit [Aciduliprofundum sp. MAR08-339]|uniref:3-isopropylmalate dehydratase small subunit n=1 Tax=Aciduliprofundum sp. (strain MAR08-339) TaxID=673860 RepID=UPI0002A4B37D|nr:3-isopropylmalate dehydratase, small subunit [Aciduliprofundum sp. MAR08-339]
MGRVWKYGDDVNTDVIFPGKYTYKIMSDEEMASHALEDLDPDFAENVKPGDVIVAGKNWGYGSSREQAVKCLKAAGIKAIIAESFARIYYRNCINLGLPAITLKKEDIERFDAGDEVELDIERGIIENKTKDFVIHFPPFEGYVMDIIRAGGIIEYIRKQGK